MSKRTTQPTLEGLVCENKILEAINQLKGMIDGLYKEPYNSLISLAARVSKTEEEIDNYTASHEMTEIEQNRIRTSFLHILTDVRE